MEMSPKDTSTSQGEGATGESSMTIHQSAESHVIPPPVSELIDTPTLAAMLCVSETTVRRMVDSGKVPGVVRLGRSVRYRRSIIAKWLDASCTVMVSNSTKRGSR